MSEIDVRVEPLNPERRQWIVETFHDQPPRGWHLDSHGSESLSVLLYSGWGIGIFRPERARALGVAHVSECLTDDQLCRLRDGRAVLLCDLSPEGMPLASLGIDELCDYLDRVGIPRAHVIIASMNLRLESDLEPTGIRGILYDHWALELAHRIDTTELGDRVAEHALALTRRSWDQPLLCLNRRVKPHRLALAACLMEDGVFDRHFVSWLGVSADPAAEFDRAARILGQGAPDALPHLERLRHLPPVSFEDGSSDPLQVPHSLYAASSFSIVPETASHPDTWRISEKVLKPLIAGHMPLVWGSARSGEIIRRYGFDPVADGDLVAYDEVESVGERLAALRTAYQRVLSGEDPGPAARVPAIASNLDFALSGFRDHLRRTMVEPLGDLVAELLSAAG